MRNVIEIGNNISIIVSNLCLEGMWIYSCVFSNDIPALSFFIKHQEYPYYSVSNFLVIVDKLIGYMEDWRKSSDYRELILSVEYFVKSCNYFVRYM